MAKSKKRSISLRTNISRPSICLNVSLVAFFAEELGESADILLHILLHIRHLLPACPGVGICLVASREYAALSDLVIVDTGRRGGAIED